MQENFEIDATARETQGKGASRRLRHQGLVPGIIYGGGQAPQMFTTPHNTLVQHLAHEAFYSHVLTVKLEGSTQRVILKDLQRHPAKPFVLHLDLLRVTDTDRIRLHVPLHFINEATAPGIKAGGQASHALTDIEISCTVKDLPEYIEVDIGQMNAGDSLHLNDLTLPPGVDLPALAQEGHNDTVVTVHMPKVAVEDHTEAEEGTAD